MTTTPDKLLSTLDPEKESEVLDDIAKCVTECNAGLDNKLVISGFDDGLGSIRDYISTSCDLIDAATAFKDEKGEIQGYGFATGRWSEIFGWESVGKTALITMGMIECQKRGGLSVLIDSDSSWRKELAMPLGWRKERHLEIVAKVVEDGIDGINRVIRSVTTKKSLQNIPVFIAWDTPSAIKTIKERDSGTYGGGMAEKARLLHSMKRSLSTELYGANAHLVIVTQMIDSMEGGAVTTGGAAMKYQASWRVEIKKRGVLYNPEGRPYGLDVMFHFPKSKLFKPLSYVPVALTFENGFDNIQTNMNFLMRQDVKAIRATRNGWYRSPALGLEDNMRLDPFMQKIKELSNDPKFKKAFRDMVFAERDCLWNNPWELPDKQVSD